MEAWNHIISTAMLGTDKRLPELQQLPASVAEAAALVNGDKEEQFLQTAALVFNFRQCGMIPLQKEIINFPVAEEEDKEYCSAFSMQLLRDILEVQSKSLLKFWVEKCDAKQQIVMPDILPQLMQAGVRNCCGKRGEWLAQFNNDWKFSETANNDELWETGTLEQRVAILKASPSVTKLQAVWPQEDANTRTKLLEAFSGNVTAEDVPFFETLLTDKSKKVRDVATGLLKQHSSSSIVQQYQQILSKAVSIKKSFLKGSSLQIELPGIDENIFKTGIEKLSSSKDVSDDEYIVMQLAEFVPPHFWEVHLNSSPENIIQIFQKHKTGTLLLYSLVKAIATFKDERWAIAFMQHSDVFYIDIIPFLPRKQQDHYSIKFMQQHGESLISFATARQHEWSLELAQAILKAAARNPYRYDRSFYNDHIDKFPVSILPDVEKLVPADENLRSITNNIAEHVIKLLNLKIQTIKAFNE